MNQAAYLLKQHGALPRLPFASCSIAEERLLHRYGAWYRALHEGKLQPSTETQRRFVECARGRVPPLSTHELAYHKYLFYEQRANRARSKLEKLDEADAPRSARHLGPNRERSIPKHSVPGIDFPAPAAKKPKSDGNEKDPKSASRAAPSTSKPLPAMESLHDQRYQADSDRVAYLRYMKDQRDSLSD